MTTKVEKRDGKFFIGDKGYFQGVVRSLFLTATDIRLSRHLDFDPLDDSSAPILCDSRHRFREEARLRGDWLLGEKLYGRAVMPRP